MTATEVTRTAVLRHRFRQHQLHLPPDSSQPDAAAMLDYGIQDTGVDGAAWALANRGAPSVITDELALAWTLRGAPHAYRRADLALVATATAPFGEADAAKRIYDAAKPLRAAGRTVLESLRTVAVAMRSIVTAPTVKGELSRRLSEALDPAFLRNCRPCGAIHVYEMPFRLAALQAGLELEAGTSPPVLRRIPRLRAPEFRHLATDADPRVDVVRNHLRYYGPTTAADVAAFIEAPLSVVRARWPHDAVPVTMAGQRGPRFVLEADLAALREAEAPTGPRVLRLLGPFDPYLQARDRQLLVPDDARRTTVWRTLGRPGAIVADGELLGTWRAATSGRKLSVALVPWTKLTKRDRGLVEEEAARLARHRGLALDQVTDD